MGSEMCIRDRHVTHREAQVLVWIAHGKTNREIAQILELSPRTVNKHLEQIFRKLGVENRTAAAALVIQYLTPIHRALVTTSGNNSTTPA